MQDSRGYIWFSTEAGLCRYNGNSVRVFSAKEGLPEEATYNVLEDPRGKLWVTTSKNRILFHDPVKDIFIEAPFSKACVNNCKSRLEQIYFARAVGDDELWFCTQYRTYKVNLNSNEFIPIDPPDNMHYNFLVKQKTVLPIKILDREPIVAQVANTKIIPCRFKRGNKTIDLSVAYPAKRAPESRVLTATNKKGDCFIGFDTLLICIDSALAWKTINIGYPVLNLYVDKDDGLWISTYKGGVKYLPDTRNEYDLITSLKGLSVTGICEDEEKGMWCTTLEKGILYSRSKFVINYSNVPGLDKRMEFLKAAGDKLFTSSEMSELFELSNNNIARHTMRKVDGPNFTDIIPYNNKWIISSRASVFSTDSAFNLPKIIFKKTKGTSIGALQLAVTKDKRIFAIHRGALIEITGELFEERISLLKSVGKCVLASGNEGLLLGCADGIYRVDLANFEMKKIPGIDDQITCIIETHAGEVWITTKENGIYILKKNKTTKISSTLNLPTQRFSDIAEDSNGDIWLASNIGVINLKRPFTKQHVKIYNSLHGLNSDEVLKVVPFNKKVFVTTYEGLCTFPIEGELSNNYQSRIHVTRFDVNGNEYKPVKENIFAYNENNIRIVFDVLTYKQAGKPKFFYKVEGLDTLTQNGEGGELVFNNLSPGTYKVSLFGINSDGRTGLPVTLQFVIEKPFWFTALFLLFILVIFIAFVFFIVKLIVNRIRNKEEEKTRVNKLLAEYQMSALRAQMNPHFIFNCINSIQRYVLTNKPEEAYNYLAKFSKLIRMVLNYAEENLISLAQEMEIVELYIELEQLRFENKFNCTIEIDEKIDVNEMMVPVMIMQPYIENAIWHGLMNLEKGKTGHIKIFIRTEDELLRIIIEDNGIGLEQASLLAKKGHRSKGTQINNRRTEILNIISSGGRGNVVIEEIKENDTVKGTRVRIDIPQNNDDDE